MNRLEEYEWLITIMCDLKINYKEHHEGVLIEIINYLNNRKEAEEKTVIAKYESNQK